MRILEMISSHHWTGPAEQVLSMSRQMTDLGHQVDIAAATVPKGSLPDKVRERGLPLIEELNLYKKRFAPRMLLADFRWLGKAMSKNQYDLIHCHLSNDHSLALFTRWRHQSSVPVIRTVHHSNSVKRRRFQKLVYNPTNGIIAISDAFRRGILDNYGLAIDKVCTIPGAVDHTLFVPLADKNTEKQAFGFTPDDFVVGIVSRIKAGRGHPELIEAFSKIAGKLPNVKLAVIGRGEMKGEMEYSVKRFGLQNQVKFLGYLSTDLPQAVGMLDVKMMLGEGSDGSCRAAVEAMAAAVPVIAAPVGTMTETVQEGKTGYLLSALSVSNLENAISKAYLQRETLPQMGRAARKTVEDRYTESIRTEATLNFFERILGQ